MTPMSVCGVGNPPSTSDRKVTEKVNFSTSDRGLMGYGIWDFSWGTFGRSLISTQSTYRGHPSLVLSKPKPSHGQILGGGTLWTMGRGNQVPSRKVRGVGVTKRDCGLPSRTEVSGRP